MRELRERLQQEVDDWSKLNFPALLQKFVLRVADCEGDTSVRPESGEPKMCFQNAARLTTYKSRRYEYVEGYILIEGIPLLIHHGWCYDKIKKLIVDPTLPDDERKTLYLGKRFSAEEYLSHVDKWGYWCLFDAVGINTGLIQSLAPDLLDGVRYQSDRRPRVINLESNHE
tara:strand:+ start:4252 stop:4764 length:513 start_codon:yes stop_codon:yes gene_type:complete